MICSDHQNHLAARISMRCWHSWTCSPLAPTSAVRAATSTWETLATPAFVVARATTHSMAARASVQQGSLSELSQNRLLVERQIDALVQAMASFGAPPPGQTSFTPSQQNVLAPILGANIF